VACPESILTKNKTDLLGLVDVELLVDKLEGLDLVDEVPHTGGAGSECGYSTLIAAYLLLAGCRGEEEEGALPDHPLFALSDIHTVVYIFTAPSLQRLARRSLAEAS
jgi:hypothetical protein